MSNLYVKFEERSAFFYVFIRVKMKRTHAHIQLYIDIIQYSEAFDTVSFFRFALTFPKERAVNVHAIVILLVDVHIYVYVFNPFEAD